jgi:hypothetical protein
VEFSEQAIIQTQNTNLSEQSQSILCLSITYYPLFPLLS